MKMQKKVERAVERKKERKEESCSLFLINTRKKESFWTSSDTSTKLCERQPYNYPENG